MRQQRLQSIKELPSLGVSADFRSACPARASRLAADPAAAHRYHPKLVDRRAGLACSDQKAGVVYNDPKAEAAQERRWVITQALPLAHAYNVREAP